MFKNVFVILAAVFSVALAVLTFASVRWSGGRILGCRVLIVLSDSMGSVLGDRQKGYFNAGDLIVVRKVDPATLKAGDIVSYVSDHPDSFGATVTHMIRRSALTVKGEQGFVTYGTHTGVEDEGVVGHSQILGKFVLRIPWLGWFFSWIQNARFFSFATVVFFLLALFFCNSDRERQDVQRTNDVEGNTKER